MHGSPEATDAFIARWSKAGGSELANYQLFLTELAELLGLPRPDPAGAEHRDNAYVFERAVTFRHGDGSTSAGRIDLYRRGCFVCEAKRVKQGEATKGFDDALLRARSQAESYARALPTDEGRPPFLIVVDVGRVIELYAEFSRSGATYVPFPDPRSHRISLTALRDPAMRERLAGVWTDPLALDPSRRSAKVTREIAARLAEVAKSLEASGHGAEPVGAFLSRCLFTFFAEDIGLLPKDGFRVLLERHVDDSPTAMRMVEALWREMDSGGFSVSLAVPVLRFNGKLFKQPDVLPLTRVQIELLIEAAKAQWTEVEPAIFGTLLERALDPEERHALGAHYTPRAYVERLVLPTVIEPLREDWSNAKAAALTLAREGDLDGALQALKDFHHALCSVRVLDPACGSGNFLYVTLEHLKRLEGEVLNTFDDLDPERQSTKQRQQGLGLEGGRADPFGGETVDPHQLLGIEVNPRAAAIAEMVLWIGYLQWHYRTRGNVNPPEPVLRDFRNIECRDAVLAWDRIEFVTDEHGRPVTRWDGKTMKTSPVTGEPIPDNSARVPVERYVNPRKAAWPEADFLVGNPPFIGAKAMRRALGDGYVEALRETWHNVPESADLVMYWWYAAARLLRDGAVFRFGLITTNSIRQEFNRRIVERFMLFEAPRISIAFAIPDHPWVDTSEGADVRIAMTVAQAGELVGRLAVVESEESNDDGETAVAVNERRGKIHANLRIGVNVASAASLRANSEIGYRGAQPIGKGFIISRAKAVEFGVGRPEIDAIVRPYRNGRDIVERPRDVFAIDLFGITEYEARLRFPTIYQWLLDRVKVERDQNARATYRLNWWIFGEPVPATRRSIEGLRRYIVTSMTAKHRIFRFLSHLVLADQKLVTIALEDAWHLGVLSSSPHVSWAISTGGNLGVGNDSVYVKTRSFEPFPFPEVNHSSTTRLTHAVRALGEQLESHRQLQQAGNPRLTLTGMYNVLEKLRSGVALTAKERVIYEQGLVSVLRQIHDELDAAVLEAYGWSDMLPLLRVAHGNDAPAEGHSREDAKRAFDEMVLERLVALNAERAAEEARGLVRWLRPDFQNPSSTGAASAQHELAIPESGEDELGAATAKQRGKRAEKGARAGDSATTDSTIVDTAADRIAWPKTVADQARAVADLLTTAKSPLTLDDIAARFTARGRWRDRLPQLLDTLVALGRARIADNGFRGA